MQVKSVLQYVPCAQSASIRHGAINSLLLPLLLTLLLPTPPTPPSAPLPVLALSMMPAAG
jgi:hypothetical protein